MSHFQRESPMDFEWDESKRRLVIEQHGIDFRDAVRIFEGPFRETVSPGAEEERWLAVGLLDGIEIAVVYTIRNGRRRIITARRARTNERRDYHAYVIGGGDPPQG